MKKLLQRISNNYCWIGISEAECNRKDQSLLLTLVVVIFPEDDDEEVPPDTEFWQVSCHGVAEETICFSGGETLTISTDAKRLLFYQENEVDLFFKDNTCDPAILLGTICGACAKFFGNTQYLDRLVNQKPALDGIVSNDFGNLGLFPKSLADEIIKALADQPIQLNPFVGGMPKKWDEEKEDEIDYPPLSVLELGRSYVIAEGFTAQQKDSNT